MRNKVLAGLFGDQGSMGEAWGVEGLSIPSLGFED